MTAVRLFEDYLLLLAREANQRGDYSKTEREICSMSDQGALAKVLRLQGGDTGLHEDTE